MISDYFLLSGAFLNQKPNKYLIPFPPPPPPPPHPPPPTNRVYWQAYADVTEIRNTARGIQSSTYHWNPESKFH